MNIEHHHNRAFLFGVSHQKFKEAVLADVIDLERILLLLGVRIRESCVIPWG